MPWPTVPADVRDRVERVTGRSLEESYEGLTLMLARAVHGVYDRDLTRPARHRRTQGATTHGEVEM